VWEFAGREGYVIVSEIAEIVLASRASVDRFDCGYEESLLELFRAG